MLQSLTGIMEGDAARTANEICDNEILQTAWKALEIKNKQLAKLKSSMQRGHGMNLKNKTALGALLTPLNPKYPSHPETNLSKINVSPTPFYSRSRTSLGYNMPPQPRSNVWGPLSISWCQEASQTPASATHDMEATKTMAFLFGGPCNLYKRVLEIFY